MSTVVRFDRNAVAALFPEGSEARVEIQNAVISTIARQAVHVKSPEQIKAIIAEHLSQVHAENIQSIRSAVEEVSRQWFSESWGRLTGMREDKKRFLTAHIEGEIRTQLEGIITAKVQAATDGLIDSVIKGITDDLDRHVKRSITKTIDEAVKARFAELITKA
jgi:hypothetical protein